MRLLVTGGAGYIGSVVTAQLAAGGHEVGVRDDLTNGNADAVPGGAELIVGDLRLDAARALEKGADAVMHFAAKSLVAESVADPGLYWRQNLGGTLALLDAMRSANVPRIIFSSTAATYGEPASVPIGEAAAPRPTRPYGASQLAVHTALSQYARI